MAGHSQFANIKHRKDAQDKKRAKIFTKLTKEIIIACKNGITDPGMNPRLRNAILAAKSANIPKDRIEAAIKRGSNPHDGDNYEEMRYEGYLPGGIAIIIESLTDNRNRTASDIRSCFSKFAGSLGEIGSVSYMFEHLGLIEYPKKIVEFDKFFEHSLEAGAEDCAELDEIYQVTTKKEELNEVKESLASNFGDCLSANLVWRPSTMILVDNLEQALSIMKFIDIIEDNDDVQTVTGNFLIAADILAKL